MRSAIDPPVKKPLSIYFFGVLWGIFRPKKDQFVSQVFNQENELSAVGHCWQLIDAHASSSEVHENHRRFGTPAFGMAVGWSSCYEDMGQLMIDK